MQDRLVKKAVFEIDKLLQETVIITNELEESLTENTTDFDNLRKLQKIYTEADDWCKAINGI